MSASTRVAAETFWEYVAFALNSIVFLLIGLEIHLPTLLHYWLPILVAYLVVTVGRALMIGLGCAFVRLTRESFPWRWSVVLTWGGLRGALPMVLVLSLPKTLPYRDLLVSMTFGVALLSILLHGLTMPGLLRWLSIVRVGADRTGYEVRAGRLQAAVAGLRELDRMSELRAASPAILDKLHAEYSQLVENAEQDLRKVAVNGDELQARDLRRIRRHLLDSERDRVTQAFHHGTLGRESLQRLLADIDARLLALETCESSTAPTADTSSNPMDGRKEQEERDPQSREGQT